MCARSLRLRAVGRRGASRAAMSPAAAQRENNACGNSPFHLPAGALLPPKPASYEINMRAGGKSIMKPQHQSTWRGLIDAEEMEVEKKEKGKGR